MREKDLFLKFVNKRVSVGIPHYDLPEKLFYVHGYISELNDSFMIVQTNKGLRRIALTDIIEIHLEDY